VVKKNYSYQKFLLLRIVSTSLKYVRKQEPILEKTILSGLLFFKQTKAYLCLSRFNCNKYSYMGCIKRGGGYRMR